MIKSVIISRDTMLFFIVFFVMLMAISSSVFIYGTKRSLLWSSYNIFAEEIYDDASDLQILHDADATPEVNKNPYIRSGNTFDYDDILGHF
jgi:NADH:ubiquinone oxidoreductase subunit 4 (subunit M)